MGHPLDPVAQKGAHLAKDLAKAQIVNYMFPCKLFCHAERLGFQIVELTL